MNKSPRVIVFDVYGTLVELKERTRPERMISQFISSQGIDPALLAPSLLKYNENWGTWLHKNGLDAPPALWAQWLERQQVEVASTALFPETISVLSALMTHGYQVGVVSNLSSTYAPYMSGVLDTLEQLTGQSIARQWSFASGCTKPDPMIFSLFMQQFPQYHPSDFLMIGDKMKEDVEGPAQCGWSAIQINRPQDTLWDALARAHVLLPSKEFSP